MTPDQIKQLIRDELHFLALNSYVFEKPIQILDARNIQLGKTNGTKIGTETTQKIGLYGTTPVVQHAAISGPTGGLTQDAESRTTITSLIDALHKIGITA
jgi:hypothetical protein